MDPREVPAVVIVDRVRNRLWTVGIYRDGCDRKELKTMKTLKTFCFAALAAVLVIAAAVAQPPDGLADFSDESETGRGFPERGFMHERIAEELELTEGQKAELEALRASHWEQMEPLVERYRAARHAVGDLMRSRTFDEETVRAAAREAADKEIELVVLRLRHRDELESVLTPEQQDKAAELREGWRERSERFRGRPGHRHGRGPGRSGGDRAPGRW